MSEKKPTEKGKKKAEVRLTNEEVIEVLPLELDHDVETSEDEEEEQISLELVPEDNIDFSSNDNITLYQNDVLVDRVEHDKDDELRKSFRSKDLSEADLSEREIMPTIEDLWIEDESNDRDVSWVKRFTMVGVLLATAAGIWAFTNLGEEEVTKKERAQELRELALLSAQTDAEYSKGIANIAECAKRYVEATSIEERAKYCRDPEGTLRKMTEYYNNELTFDTYHFEGIKESSEVMLGEQMVTVASVNVSSLSGEVGLEDKPLSLLLVKQKDGKYLIDWETAVVYQPSDWDTFIAARNTEPGVFRVEAKERINYGPYLYEFSDDSKYQAYRISIRGENEKFLIGYAKKDSDIDEKMKSLVVKKSIKSKKSKITAPMMLKLVFPKDAQSNQCVEIIEVVSDFWFLR